MIYIIIPARGGSKGIKDKNLKIINNKTLIAHSIEAGINFKNNNKMDIKIVLTSDSDKILDEGRKYKDIIIIKRPEKFSTDESLTIDAILHVISNANIKEEDHILILQPTVPFRPLEEIKEILKLYFNALEKNFKSFVSLVDSGDYHPFRQKRLLSDGSCISYIDQGCEDLRPRQNLPKTFLRSGSYYICPVSDLKKNKSILPPPTFGYIHKEFIPVNIDNKNDLLLAEIQLKEFE